VLESLIAQIEKPTLLLDKQRAVRNIDRMAAKASRNGVVLRPHFKTHQSAEIGEWFRDRRVDAITVSSVDMAEYFVDNGWGDVTIAFPANPRQSWRLNKLAGRAQIGVLVESEAIVQLLNDELSEKVRVWLKIDAGYHRTGMPWDDFNSIERTALAVIHSDHLLLKGILTHAGHTYHSGSAEDIEEIYLQVLDRMKQVRHHLDLRDIKVSISVGDTPGCSIVEDLGEVDEIRPGNFVFFDLSQLVFGSCRVEDIAVAVACPVVSIHPDRNQIIIYGGAIHLSKELLPGTKGKDVFGKVVLAGPEGWTTIDEGNEIISLSQEHGIVQATDGLIGRTKVGDILLVLPVHSCLTANLLGHYLTLDGQFIEMARY